jgi:hypothetical protein
MVEEPYVASMVDIETMMTLQGFEEWFPFGYYYAPYFHP